MKITKFVHSCLLVETNEPAKRVVLFDPGEMSREALEVASIESLDDIFITHEHQDHFDIELVKKFVAKFPNVRITTTHSIADQLKSVGVDAYTEAPEGVEFFESPHEGHAPMFNPPEEVGINYLGLLSHPGDSHSFTQTKDVLALPIAAPWGSTDRAVQLALELKPKYIVPIHDWHWKDVVREEMYERLELLFKNESITFFKMQTGMQVGVDL